MLIWLNPQLHSRFLQFNFYSSIKLTAQHPSLTRVVKPEWYILASRQMKKQLVSYLLILAVMTYSDLSHINDEFRKSSEFRQESQNQLKDLTKELSKVRKQNQIFKEQQNQVPQLMVRIHNLESELNLLHEKEQRNSKIPKISMMTTETSDYQNLLQQIETLQELLTDSEKREQHLHQELANINGDSGISALKCKKIISLCCNIPLNQVDDFIQPLLKAMESDEPELLDIEQVADFMNRLKQKPSQSTT